MGMSFTRLTQTIEKRQLATPVNLLHQNLRINPSESLSLGLGHGGCAHLEQLDNLLDLPHATLGVLETIRSV